MRWIKILSLSSLKVLESQKELKEVLQRKAPAVVVLYGNSEGYSGKTKFTF